jgi:hypothetical protein
MARCIACDEIMVSSMEINRGYCDGCQTGIREVWDKDAFILGQEAGKEWTDLAWTNLQEDEYDI